MCNDYQRHLDWAEFQAALAEAQLGSTTTAKPEQLSQVDDVRVNDVAPIIVKAGNAVELAPMRWGFTPRRQGGAPIFNFRSEGRDFSQSNRCLVPASAFFEFTGKSSPKTKWRFKLKDSSVFAVAGLWREDEGGKAFTMLTTSPGADVAPFHDRQVVVLSPPRWADWLYDGAAKLLTPLSQGSLVISLARQGKDEVAPDLLKLARATTW